MFPLTGKSLCRVGVLLAMNVMVWLSGCAAPTIDHADIADPDLRAINIAFMNAVDTANNDSTIFWHHGWLGNMTVNFKQDWDAEHLGLCYQWQEYVYEQVLPVVRHVGWAATGIGINVDQDGEHHAVLVFDPADVAKESILIDPLVAQRVYVLDAWLRGRADLHRLDAWLEHRADYHAAPVVEVVENLRP